MDPRSLGFIAGLIGAVVAVVMSSTPAHWAELRARFEKPPVDAGVP
jgi:hypothetical protein